jgi:hypothetical protein
MPQVGGSVLVSFLGSSVRGTVDSVDPDGRRLGVTTVEGETLVFALNRATGTFTLEGHQTGARLAFEPDPGD